MRADEPERLGLFGLLLPIAAGHRNDGCRSAALGAFCRRRDRSAGAAGRSSPQPSGRDGRCWLAHAGTLAPTAEALSIHRNTLAYRLQRVTDVTGYDLDDARIRYTLRLALDVRRLLAAD